VIKSISHKFVFRQNSGDPNVARKGIVSGLGEGIFYYVTQ
jgi:hypothetical protein